MSKLPRNIVLNSILLLSVLPSLFGQGFSHKGREFIIPSVWLDSYQIITDQFSATVTIEDYGYATTTTYNIPADTCYQLSLSSSPTLAFNSIFGYGFNWAHRSVKKSVRITSSTPIYVQAQSHYGSTSLPHSGFGTYPVIPKEYARSSVTIYNKNRPDTLSSNSLVFVITSFQDSTDIEVKPTHNSHHGWKKDSTYLIRLDKGECYTIPTVINFVGSPGYDSTYNNNDFSGSSFTTLNPCHKISVMYMHQEVIEIPSTMTGILNADNLFEEFPPIEYLRTTSFVVPEKITRLPDLIHVHAIKNNTQVFFDGQYVITLQKNQQWDTLFDEPVKIQGSNPIFVTQYFLSRHFVTDTIDPEMMIVYPIQFRTSTFNFFLNRKPPIDPVIRQLSIITDSFNVNTFTLNGVPIPASRFTPFAGDSSMVYAAYRISSWGQFFSLKSTGTFQAWVTNSQRQETEAYQSPLDSVLPIPPPPPPYYMDTCLYDTVPLEGKESALGWLWNTGDTSMAINIATAGTYWVQNFYCIDTIVDTFDITGFLYSYLKDSICYGDSLWFGGGYISQPGFHYDTTNLSLTCDTVIRLSLSYFNPVPVNSLNSDTLCKGDSLVIGTHAYTQTGFYYDTLYYSNGCDSAYLQTEIYVSEDTTFLFDTICDNQTVTFFGNTLSAQEIYYQTETNSISCDSIIVLELTVYPTYYLRYDTAFCIKDSVFMVNRIINEKGINQFPFLNQFGCDSLIEVNITNYCPNIAFIPNSFTPNGDGDNEVFLPVFVNQDEIENYSLLIFNRWGEIVFESTDVLSGWDGKQSGTLVHNDVFIWKIRYKANNETKELIGHVQVVR